MFRTIAWLGALAAIVSVVGSAPAHAVSDPNVLCQKTIVKQLEKFKKAHLKAYQKCLDKENKGDIASCLDAVSDAKLDATALKVQLAIAKKCTVAMITGPLGFRGDCQYGPSTPGIGGTCAGMTVSSPETFAACMECWKGAEFSRFVGTIYASHAQEVCGTALDDTSATCSAIGCTAPTPNQRDLGDNAQNDCQRALAKASLNYLLKREKIIDRCLLKGLSFGACLADPKLQLQLIRAEAQKETLILNFCNNYEPVAAPPFCCRTGMGQTCTVAVDRDDCLNNLSGTVQEGKVCSTTTCVGGGNNGAACTTASECPGGACGGSCDNIPGPNKSLTWWEHCPNNEPCPGPTLGDIDGVIQCVDDLADELVGNVLCLQFPNGSTCPTPVVPTPTVTPTP
jgi:hypothetical protein